MTTPMLQQYYSIKSDLSDTIVLFRLGDFYEAFEKDAEDVSNILGITLTGRGKGDNRVPMAGIPYHALDNYLPKLVHANRKVAIVEQTTPAGESKLVKREIVRIVTPGTFSENNPEIVSNSARYISSVFHINITYAIAYMDVSTGEFKICKFESKNLFDDFLLSISPLEILVSQKDSQILPNKLNSSVEVIDNSDFQFERNSQILLRHFRLDSLKGLGLTEEIEVIVAGSLLRYVLETQKSNLNQILYPKLENLTEFMNLDVATVKNLEILSSTSNYSLFSVLNRCKTNIGRRMLYTWLSFPLKNLELINQRQSSVANFLDNFDLTVQIQEKLKYMSDIPKILGKIGQGRVNGRDLVGLKASLNRAMQIHEQLDNHAIFKSFANILNPVAYEPVINIIEESIDEDCPVTFDRGGIIKTGFNSEIDELRMLQRDGGKYLSDLQIRERERTGISSLKVKYNKVFGYYIEISNTNLSKVPTDYIRKQTLVNGERYITEELKEYESKILSAEDKLLALEKSLFDEVASEVASFIPTLSKVSETIGQIDVLSNFAVNAHDYSYCRPEFNSNSIIIAKGRHPVVEQIKREEFIPNNLDMNSDVNISIITGPNMSGKSTFIRQIGLISIMAQIGSFVPATTCKLPVFDRIFSRVGASDNLVYGESTFMVEMLETANILNNSTSNSLIILDEIGRGTSTYDGVAIAWSIVEFLAKQIKAKTLFATHYHELISLEKHYSGIQNLHVVVDEEDNQITFTHRIAHGGTDRSYGIHVAEIAGLPIEVVKRATAILKDFENTKTSSKSSQTKKSIPPKPDTIQFELL